MRQIILTQRAERDRLLRQKYIPREGLKKLRDALSHTLIKLITGPRRAGKSVFALEALGEQDFAYINFDDERIPRSLNGDDLINGVLQVYGNTRMLLLDEIQNIDRWELLLDRLRRNGYNMIVTGSNSNLLSGDLASHLTGRYMEFQVLPFSFTEFLTARGRTALSYPETREEQGAYLRLFTEYLQRGGYPEVAINTSLEHTGYLSTLLDGIIMKDIVNRYKIRNTQVLRSLALYLLTNHSTSMSWRNITEALSQKSVTTIQAYASYIHQAYLMFTVPRFSFKMKEQIKSPFKIYAYDTGMINAASFKFSENMGRILENAVAVELSRSKQHEIFYYKADSNKEVDFVVKDGLHISELIQVCYDITDPRTKRRELSALAKTSRDLKCTRLTVLTWDQEGTLDESGISVRLMPAARWFSER